jgi:ribosomal protein L11 methyltransferase
MAAANNIPAGYVAISFRVPATRADDAAGLIVAAGALGCAVLAPFKPHPRPARSITLEAYFRSLSAGDLLEIRRTLKAAELLENLSQIPVQRLLIDPGWASMWMDRFGPLRIGRRLEIVPPWKVGAKSSRVRIVIKPGQAFGTGHHGTTRGVLRSIERLTQSSRFQSALDVGTGSGILALAMIKLGVGRVCAIDLDEIAIANARENARLNRMSAKVNFSARTLSTLRNRYDLITANIISSTLIEIAVPLIRRMNRGGVLILSGVLRREISAVAAVYNRHLSPLWASLDRGWATLVFLK